VEVRLYKRGWPVKAWRNARNPGVAAHARLAAAVVDFQANVLRRPVEVAARSSPSLL